MLNCLCIKFATTTAQCPSLTMVKKSCNINIFFINPDDDAVKDSFEKIAYSIIKKSVA